MTIEDIEAPDLDVWLGRLGLPRFAKGAGGGTIVLDGDLSDPTAEITLQLSGVPCLDKLALHGFAKGDTLDLGHLSTAAFGGELAGSARLRLGNTPYIEKLHLAGGNLAAAKLCGLAGIAKGNLDSVELDLHGSIDNTRPVSDWMDLASASIKARHLEVYGDGYANVQVCVNRSDDASCRPRPAKLADTDLADCTAAKRGGFCAVATATRDDGGTLDATIAQDSLGDVVHGKRVTSAPHLGGTIALGDVPLAILNRFTTTQKVGGLASATLHLTGTPDAPQATGAVQLLRGWALGGFIGDSQLAIEPTTLPSGMPGIALRGGALANRLGITATIGAAAPYPVDVRATAVRIEVDPFVDLAAMVKSPDPIEAWASGTVSVHTELAPAGGKAAKPDAWIELTELDASIHHRTIDGRLIPLAVRANADEREPRAAVSIHVTPTTLELACRDPTAATGSVPCATAFATPAGRHRARGPRDDEGEVDADRERHVRPRARQDAARRDVRRSQRQGDVRGQGHRHDQATELRDRARAVAGRSGARAARRHRHGRARAQGPDQARERQRRLQRPDDRRRGRQPGRARRAPRPGRDRADQLRAVVVGRRRRGARRRQGADRARAGVRVAGERRRDDRPVELPGGRRRRRPRDVRRDHADGARQAAARRRHADVHAAARAGRAGQAEEARPPARDHPARRAARARAGRREPRHRDHDQRRSPHVLAVDIDDVFGTIDGEGALDDIAGPIELRDGTPTYAHVTLDGERRAVQDPGHARPHDRRAARDDRARSERGVAHRLRVGKSASSAAACR